VGIGCSAVASGVAVASLGVRMGACDAGGAGAPAVVAGTAGFVSRGATFPGVATTGDVPVEPEAGGFTITGPDGARDAMAGV
jgi:hypothetical protein